jgi:hypothetical protein
MALFLCDNTFAFLRTQACTILSSQMDEEAQRKDAKAQ